MRKTKLMELTEKHNTKKDIGYADTYVVDPLIYMACDLAEGAFGSDIIEALAEEIVFTQTNANRAQTLEFIANAFIRDHVTQVFSGLAKDILELKPLSEETHADYFVAFMKIESEARGSEQKAAAQLQAVLFGITSSSPYSVLTAIVEFFVSTNNRYGLFLLLQKTCRHLKAHAAMEDDYE